VTKSAGQEHASPSSSLPAYVFRSPAYVAIRTRTNDQPRYVDTQLKVWTWYDGGIALKIDWSAIQLNSELIEIGKGFMAYALEKYAPRTAAMFADTLRFLPGTNLAAGLPWATDQLITALGEIKKTRTVLVGFRRFYRWAMDRGINGFDPITYLKIKEIKSDRVDPYARIFLSQSGLVVASSPRARLGGSGYSGRHDCRTARTQQHGCSACLRNGHPQHCPDQRESTG